jgi:histidinol-phosphate aminotransferase
MRARDGRDVAVDRPVRAEVLLDWGESPIGPSENAARRVTQAAPHLHRYPRGLLEEVTEQMAAHLRVAPDEVLLTAGVDEAVDVALACADRAWGVQPGFDGYVDRARATGKPITLIPLGSEWQPAPGSAAGLGHGDMVLVAQPNNPTGNLFDERWIKEVRQSAQYLFLDETYQEFSTRGSLIPEIATDPGLIVFRSFSKAMGLAGIRFGCLVADARTLARMRPLQRFLPIDSVSLNAVAGTLEDPGFIGRLTAYVRQERTALSAILRESGVFGDVRETEANFVLAQARRGTAAAVLAWLEADGIRVKECASFGLPGWFRISVGSHTDHWRLRECLAGMSGVFHPELEEAHQ